MIGHLLWITFGPGTWGAGGNMLAWVLCGGIGFGRLYVKQKAQHRELKAQAERHHKEQLEQAGQQHEELKAHIADCAAGGAL